MLISWRVFVFFEYVHIKGRAPKLEFQLFSDWSNPGNSNTSTSYLSFCFCQRWNLTLSLCEHMLCLETPLLPPGGNNAEGLFQADAKWQAKLHVASCHLPSHSLKRPHTTKSKNISFGENETSWNWHLIMMVPSSLSQRYATHKAPKCRLH